MTLQTMRAFRHLAVAGTAVALAIVLAHATPARATNGPYRSALTRVGSTTTTQAACNHRICEFVHPGFHCLYEGGATSCVKAPGGCTNVSCN